MSSFRQIEANRRNAQLSTGPVTEEGKKKSRQNAVRHGLTAETVIDALEDAEDYTAFEMAVAADYDVSKESSCSDWRASYGGCAAPPPSRAACSRFKRNTCCNFDNGNRLIRTGGRLSTAYIETSSPLKKTSGSRMTRSVARLLNLIHHQPESQQITPRTSLGRLFA